MDLDKFLFQERAAILKGWFDLVLGTYPAETANLLRKETNRFANPVGYSLSHGMEGIFDVLHRGMDREKVMPFLDEIIRIRAIQDYSPAQGLAFVFLLKRIIREAAARIKAEDAVSPEDLLSLESQIDEVALLAFNIYVACRERLSEVRVNELKNRTFRLLQRANLLEEIPEWKAGSGAGNTESTT